jgi:hypothetical protein
MSNATILPTPQQQPSNDERPDQQQHAPHHRRRPLPDGWECVVTMEEITEQNYVEYQCFPSLQWKSSKMEQCVIEELLRTQFDTYLQRVQRSDCQAELRRLLQSGPPIYLSDPIGLPLKKNEEEEEEEEDNMDTHIVQLWYASDGQIRSAKLQKAREGHEREELWKELNAFVIDPTTTAAAAATARINADATSTMQENTTQL